MGRREMALKMGTWMSAKHTLLLNDYLQFIANITDNGVVI